MVPAGTIAALAVITPVGALSVDTSGLAFPAGQVVRKSRWPLGMEV